MSQVEIFSEETGKPHIQNLDFELCSITKMEIRTIIQMLFSEFAPVKHSTLYSDSICIFKEELRHKVVLTC